MFRRVSKAFGEASQVDEGDDDEDEEDFMMEREVDIVDNTQ